MSDGTGISSADFARDGAAGAAPLTPSFLRAVHLAGHAVAAVVCGGEYGPLDVSSAGARVEGGYECGFREPVGLAGGGPARNATEAAIIVALAGGEAEALITGGAAPICSDVTSRLTDGDPAEAGPYLEWLRLKAARAITHPLRERLVLRLAERLQHGPLAGSEVIAVTNGEISRYMRGQ